MGKTTTLKLNQQQLEVLLDAIEGQSVSDLSTSEVDEHDALLNRLAKALDRVA